MSLTFSRPIPRGVNHLHMLTSLPYCRPLHPPGLAIETLNIRDCWGFGMTQAIRMVERGGFDMMLITKIKISMIVYCRNWPAPKEPRIALE